MFITLSQNMKTINAITIPEVDITSWEDTVVQGEYYYKDQIGATVEVTITDGTITDIRFIEHLYGLGGKAEVIIDDIIAQQTLQVDDVAGATTSSHVIKLAILNALEEE
ncbi:FMN-binding protein [Candidatus Xianfuyuplasma coldseepsis]|uniref:FMN-binding protein n=2 Tax=Candidatus Xianfuyuplasma coldseepsis TaxID=2782163 RepID=A0A7L7KUS7_9MOLU|nr:FMN-binding protein [Xianfuyuplasma coldseepsis]